MNGIVVTVGRNIDKRMDTIERFGKSIALQTQKPMWVCVVVLGTPDEATKIHFVLQQHLLYHKLHVLYLQDRPGPYPEALMKNIGIRHLINDCQAHKICATNIDIVFSPNFFETVFANTGDDNTLVQALRLDSMPDGPEVGPDASYDGKVTIIVSPRPEDNVPTPVLACGDCQSMTAKCWDDLAGYDDRMVGWGVLDVDLQCRAMMTGKSLIVLSALVARHIHVFHPGLTTEEKAAYVALPRMFAQENMVTSTWRPAGDRWGYVTDCHLAIDDNQVNPLDYGTRISHIQPSPNAAVDISTAEGGDDNDTKEDEKGEQSE